METVILAELGAILVVRPQNSTPSHACCERPGSELSPDADQAVVVEGSLACVESRATRVKVGYVYCFGSATGFTGLKTQIGGR